MGKMVSETTKSAKVINVNTEPTIEEVSINNKSLEDIEAVVKLPPDDRYLKQELRDYKN